MGTGERSEGNERESTAGRLTARIQNLGKGGIDSPYIGPWPLRRESGVMAGASAGGRRGRGRGTRAMTRWVAEEEWRRRNRSWRLDPRYSLKTDKPHTESWEKAHALHQSQRQCTSSLGRNLRQSRKRGLRNSPRSMSHGGTRTGVLFGGAPCGPAIGWQKGLEPGVSPVYRPVGTGPADPAYFSG